MHAHRILIAAALGEILAAALENALPTSQVAIATTPDEIRRAVAGQPRFDAAVVDLSWHHRNLEWHFDGLDVLEILRAEGRMTTCILTPQGESYEDDFITESMDRDRYPEIAGLIDKPAGLGPIPINVEAAALGLPLPGPHIEAPPKSPPLHEHFSRGRGRTAGVLAAAVASGRVATYRDLADLANVAPDTANKLTGYLGPLLQARGDIPPEAPVTQPVIYRWCGEHARYLLSWARRNLPPGHGITRWEADP